MFVRVISLIAVPRVVVTVIGRVGRELNDGGDCTGKVDAKRGEIPVQGSETRVGTARIRGRYEISRRG